MTRKTRKSLATKFIVLAIAALTAFVVALQFIAAPVTSKKYNGGNNIASDPMNGVKVQYSDAPTGMDPDVVRKNDDAISADAKSEFTPKPDEKVSVIIEFNGTPIMDAAFGRGLSVGEYIATDEGKNDLKVLSGIKNKALDGISKYILETRLDYSTVINGVSATVRYADVANISRNKYVKNVILSNSYLAPKAVTENNVDVYESGIFDSSNIGYDGTGTVVAVLDTGTDYTHEVFDMELDLRTLAMSKDDVASVAPLLTATSLSAAKGETIDEDNLYLTSKLPFAYDYADGDTNVYPLEAHGTHVAGIIAGKSDVITGVAPRAQIATFKVFSDYSSGADTEYILAALNDAVTLNVDAINMSLGTSCGFSREADDDAVNDIYDRINDAGICLVVAASNDASSAQASTWGNTNLASNPDSGTVGSPASYDAALSVASISGVKTKYFVAGGKEIYFAESRMVGKTDSNDFVAELLGDRSEGEFEYVVVPGVGLSVNYNNVDVSGKIAVVRRGTSNFEEKVRVAHDHGAAGVIVYNNVSGTISMSVGTTYLIPSCFVTMDVSKEMVEAGSGTIKLSKDYLAGPFMSDFSSWGVLPDLTLVPDITAHGGEIYSSFPGGDMYDRISGTSMACPNLAGALILVRQSVKETHPEFNTNQVRDESYSRMMSTATIVLNEDGNPYSPRKQGAGLANIAGSINTGAYLTVDGSNKPKLSLGDDPDRTGVYTLEFNLVNVTGNSVSYRLNPYVMTESMSSDNRTVAEKAHMFDDTSVKYGISTTRGNAELVGNIVSVGGYGEVKITATISLSDADKAYIDGTFRNGMYVEGYMMLDAVEKDGIDLNIPYLAFYGSWAEAPMLDVSAYEVGASQADDSVIAEDKLVADVYGTLPYSGFASETATDGVAYYGMGDFAYIVAPGYEPPPAQEKFAALTTNPDGDYLLYMISAGLLRGAKRVDMEIHNSVTGEVIWTGTDYNARKTHASGEQVGGYVEVELDIRELDLPNNSKYTFSMECFLDWKDGNDEYIAGNNNKFSFEFTVDNEAPQIADMAVRKEASGSSYRYYLDITAYDNHYLQGFAVGTYNAIETNQYGYQNFVGYENLTGGMVPVDGNFNSNTILSLNITSQWSRILENDGKLYVTLVDYAKNSKASFVKIEQEDDLEISTVRNTSFNYDLRPNEQIDLGSRIRVAANTLEDQEPVYVEGYWTKDLIWESSDPDTVEVGKDGLVTGLKAGTASITVRTPNTTVFDEADTKHCIKFTVTVAGDPKELMLTGFELSADALTLERGEEATVSIKAMKPYNYPTMPEVEWVSTSPNVKIVGTSEDGKSVTIRAMESGTASIRVTVKNSRVSGYCNVYVKQEFQISDNIYLRSYTGRGDEHGVVEIPDDLGIVYIYPQAFLGNKFIKKVIIPEGVMTIMHRAFVNCTALEEVVLPDTLETIDELAFANDSNLTKINLGKVKTIGNSAFWGCGMEEIDLSSCTYIHDAAFIFNQNLKKLDLSRVGMIGGGAFAVCNGLTELDIPANVSMGKPYDFETDEGVITLGAFDSCENLKKVTLRTKNVGEWAFARCKSLEEVVFVNDVNEIGDCAFVICPKLAKITYGGSVYKIGNEAFAYYSESGSSTQTALKEIVLPDGLTVLGMNAFAGHTQLTKVKISSGALLTDLSMAAFNGLPISEFVVENGNRYLSSESGVLYDKNKTRLVLYPWYKSNSLFTVPSTVKTIGKSAFSIAKVTNVNLSNVEYIESLAFAESSVASLSGYNNVKYIGDGAFYGTNLQTLPLSDNTVYIGDEAFENSKISGTLNVPANVEYIGGLAFANTGLTGINFATGKKLKSVGAGAFAACQSLTTVNFGSTLERLSEYMFGSLSGKNQSGATVIVGCSNLKNVEIPSTVKAIGMGAFAGSGLTRVTLPASLNEIAPNAFLGTKLTSVNLPNTVSVIGDYAFAETPLATINLDSVTSIGEYAFAATNLKTVAANKVTAVGAHAFDSSAVTSVTMPAVTIVGDYAFNDCAALATVDISAATKIGEGAFSGCSNITSLNLSNVKELGGKAFNGATKLGTVVFGKLEKIMGEKVFYGTAVTTLNLPDTLNSVADGAFLGAEKLGAINVNSSNDDFVSDNGVLYKVNDDNYYILVGYPAGKTATTYNVLDRTIKLGAYSFNNNKHLETLTLPVYLQVIGISAMSGMNNLEVLNLYATSAPILESSGYYQDYDDVNKENEYINVYDNFSFANTDEGKANSNLVINIPQNNTGYDNRIWKEYVGTKLHVSDKVHATLATLNIIERINKLPADPTAADANEINTLARLYNILDAAQRLIVSGGTYGSSTITNIDVAYYTSLFKGENFYAKLTAAQGKLPKTALSVTVSESGNYGIAANNGGVFIAAIVALCACVIALGIVVAVVAIKRRGR